MTGRPQADVKQGEQWIDIECPDKQQWQGINERPQADNPSHQRIITSLQA